MDNEQYTNEGNIESVVNVDKPRSSLSQKQWIILVVIFLVSVLASFRSGIVLGNKGFSFQAKEFKIINQKDQPKEVDYSLLWEALNVVSNKYIEKPVDQQKILYGAIKGAVAASGDAYTEFFTPEELVSFRTELRGSFEGIGAEIGKRNNAIVVVSPIENAPADKAGLRAKDVIVSVNGESTADLSVEQAVGKIRGPKGSEVTLTIYREGQAKTFDVVIMRDTIEIKSVKLEYKEQNGKKVAYLKVARFGDDTKTLFAQAVQDIKRSGASSIVLDLRNDPGGYLETAVDLASYWLPKNGLVVTEEHSSGTPITYNSYGYGMLSGLKTIVLINGGSASASEILAGALRDTGAASLMGEKSFGKGSVQELIELNGGGAVKVTVAKWITPSGKNLNKDGLVPDIEVKISEEDINADRDPQLTRALEEIIK